MNQLALMDLYLFEEIPCTYGLTEMMDLADHVIRYSENLVHEWTAFISFIGEVSSELRSIQKWITVLMNESLGLTELYPNILKLMSVAAVLALITAEVERVFSQVMLIKCYHRNRLKKSTLHNLLHIKINCHNDMFCSILDNVVTKFFKVKQRRLCQNYWILLLHFNWNLILP